MFSLCISNEKKFHHSTKGTVTVVPVFVEFSSVYPLDSNSINPRIDNGDDAGIELLHTVASLYYKNLPNTPLNVIYETLCKEGVKTLLLLRHGEEILTEWRKDSRESRENVQLSPEDSFPKKDSVDYCCASKLLSSPDEFTYSSVSSGFPCKDSSPSFEEMSTISSCSKTFSSGIISDLDDLECDKISSLYETETQTKDNFTHEDDGNHIHHHDNKLSTNQMNSISKEPEIGLKKSNNPHWSETLNYRDLEAKIKRCFNDDDETKSANEDIDWDGKNNQKLTQLLRSGSKFLDTINERREERLNLISKSPEKLNLDHVSIEHRIIGSISFHKDYRLPSMPIIFIDWLIVRDSYRSSKIGTYLVKKIKSSSFVGSYHLMCVNCPSNQSINFFRSLNFINDDLSECRLRPLLPKKLTSQLTDFSPRESSLLFYYPSFNRTNSSSISSQNNLFNCQPFWFDLSIKSISDEIDFWKEKSIESYHDQITLIMRLKSEIVKLHNQLKSRDKQLKEIKQENKELRHIVTQSNAMAAISTIDELGSLFESIKDLCSVVR